MNKLYPSGIAPVFGYTTNSYKESCPRFYAMSRALGLPRGDIDELYKLIGRLAEEKVRQDLIAAKTPSQEITFEIPLRHEVAPGWMISGRYDALVRDRVNPGRTTLWEIKATISAGKKRRIFDQGELDVKYIGQLVTYMLLTEIPRGVISCHYFEFNEARSALKILSRNFGVVLDKDRIFVDGKLWETHTVKDFTRYYALMMDAVEGVQLPAKTMNARACESCPFNLVCEKSPRSKEEFRSLFETLGEGKVKTLPNPRIKRGK